MPITTAQIGLSTAVIIPPISLHTLITAFEISSPAAKAIEDKTEQSEATDADATARVLVLRNLVACEVCKVKVLFTRIPPFLIFLVYETHMVKCVVTELGIS